MRTQGTQAQASKENSEVMASSSDAPKSAASKKGTGGLGFLAAKIKKLMQKDDDVGRISATVPFMIARSVELLLKKICERSGEIAKGRGASQLTSAQIKACINEDEKLDFLKSIVASAPDLGSEVQEASKGRKRERAPRSKKEDEPATKGRKKGSKADASLKEDQEVDAEEEPMPPVQALPPREDSAHAPDPLTSTNAVHDDVSLQAASAAAAAAVAAAFEAFESLEGLDDASKLPEPEEEDDYDG